MPSKSRRTLNGNVPDAHPVALLLVDVINEMSFEQGGRLARYALPKARNIARLARKAREAGVPVIYANDNFGRWRSDFREVIAQATEAEKPGAAIARLLSPEPDDYFVLKPHHSAFYHTPLDTLLRYLGTQRLVITGFAGDVCVFFTAHDGYLREFRLNVPSDCVASVDQKENQHALAYMRRVLDVDTTPSGRLDIARLARRKSER
jgi:nicotinamidase-related amidase